MALKRLGMNLEDFNSPNLECPALLNIARLGRQDYYNRLNVSGVGYGPNELNDEGWVTANQELVNPLPAGAELYQVFVCGNTHGIALVRDLNAAGIQMKCTWENGAAVTSVAGLGDTGTVTYDLDERWATWTMQASQSGAVQGGNYTTDSRLGFVLDTGVSTEPPTNIKVFKAEHEARVIAGEIFDPDWKAQIANFSPIRVMDALRTNHSVVRDYTDWATESYLYWGENMFEDQQEAGRKCGVPITAIVNLINDIDSDLYICLPNECTDALVTTLATNLKNTVEAGRHIYVEFSNEVWNFYSQYLVDQGNLIPEWSADNDFTVMVKFGGLRSARCMEIFRTVFGTDSGVGRWTGIIASQGASSGSIVAVLAGVDYHLDNDDGAADDITKLYSHAAIAPYVGPGPVSIVQPQAVTLVAWANESISRDDDYAYFNQQLYDACKLTAMSSSTMQNILFWQECWQTHMATVAPRGLTTIMYEVAYGGVCGNPLKDNLSGETEGDKLNLALSQFAETTYCAQLVSDLLNLFIADGGEMPVYFSSFGVLSKSGPWPFKQHFNDAAPRGKCSVSWSRGASYPAQRYRLTAS